jgi:deoxyribonuclease-4
MSELGDASQKKGLLFGTAGVPPSTPRSNSVMGITQIRALGLDCMELAFVRSVRMGTETAATVKQVATDQQVALSVHAPYYINLNSADSSKVIASRERILKAARVGWQCGACHIVFHAGYYHDDPAEIVYERIRQQLLELSQQLLSEGNLVQLRPETTGKMSQFGTLEELLELSGEVERIAPCVDFAHLHARSNQENSYEEFIAQLKLIEDKLGRAGLEDMHIHVSGIEYSALGERKHLMLREGDLNYEELLQALVDQNVEGRLVCESPDTEKDALLLQQTYHGLRRRSEMI